ncbi:hypothetical protein GCM10028803_06510 [Larkinella knui]|uniref:Uncharacterized protein n=1 Tax=Larkinella knui TaxID=2025310 RepID=A0A3P1CL81_9BACT|nr:hypothetical protein [Larkinella knui]RRB13674.1 hypothetical protein EHT87_15555 [Larkinella knui]
MQPQHNPNIEKLIWNESFRKWVLQPTAESDAFWYLWQVSNPDRAADFRLARTVVAALQVHDRPLPEAELQQLIARTVALAKKERPFQSAKPVFRLFRWPLPDWTAFVLLVSTWSRVKCKLATFVKI